MDENPNFAEQLQAALQANRKGVKDLIGQEVSLWLLAEHIRENPEKEAQIPNLFQQIYRRLSHNVKELFYELLEQQGLEADPQALEASIELFVHELVQDYESNFYAQLRRSGF